LTLDARRLEAWRLGGLKAWRGGSLAFVCLRSLEERGEHRSVSPHEFRGSLRVEQTEARGEIRR
jgi:hypothetical protein